LISKEIVVGQILKLPVINIVIQNKNHIDINHLTL
jgi:hypothetical protein